MNAKQLATTIHVALMNKDSRENSGDDGENDGSEGKGGDDNHSEEDGEWH